MGWVVAEGGGRFIVSFFVICIICKVCWDYYSRDDEMGWEPDTNWCSEECTENMSDNLKVGDCWEDELAGEVLRATLKMQCVRVWAVFIEGRMWFGGKTVTSKFSFHVYRNKWRKVSLRSKGL